MTRALPGADAAVDHMQHALDPEPREQARGHCAALAGAADRCHRPLGIDPVGHRVDVVVRDVDRAGDSHAAPLVELTDVEDLNRPVALAEGIELLRVDPPDPLHLAALDAPGRHPAAEEAAELADADRGGELR